MKGRRRASRRSRLYPPDWKSWDRGRKRFRWRWGDPEILETARGEIGCWVGAERLTVLHPHLRRPEHHDLLWDVKGHEAAHALFPARGHRWIETVEREIGQFLHDLTGCRKCEQGKRAR